MRFCKVWPSQGCGLFIGLYERLYICTSLYYFLRLVLQDKINVLDFIKNYLKTWILGYCKSQMINFGYTSNLSKASICNRMKNLCYPFHLPYLLQGSCMVSILPSYLPCSSLLSTLQMCAWDQWWLLTASVDSWQLFRVTKSATHGHVAVEKGI